MSMYELDRKRGEKPRETLKRYLEAYGFDQWVTDPAGRMVTLNGLVEAFEEAFANPDELERLHYENAELRDALDNAEIEADDLRDDRDDCAEERDKAIAKAVKLETELSRYKLEVKNAG